MPISSSRCCDGVIAAAGSAAWSANPITRSTLAASCSSRGASRLRPANCRPKSTFAATVSPAKTRGVWKVRAMPWRA